jgi:hypothetical protein
VQLDVEADFSVGTLTSISSSPPMVVLEALVGTTVYGGFRRTAREAVGGGGGTNLLLLQLIDDLPIAVMLSGRVLRANGFGLGDPNGPRPVDICAGWVPGGTLLEGYTDLGPPLEPGPVAVAVERADDPLSWHDDQPLPTHSTRRRRRLDVWVEADIGRAECFFRDSHADADAVETVVHEYTVQASIDLSSMQIVACEAIPGPLPYSECPNAALSAGRLDGAPIAGLRQSIRAAFVGPSTCTHLNDSLRSLEDVGALLQSLQQNERQSP